MTEKLVISIFSRIITVLDTVYLNNYPQRADLCMRMDLCHGVSFFVLFSHSIVIYDREIMRIRDQNL